MTLNLFGYRLELRLTVRLKRRRRAAPAWPVKCPACRGYRTFHKAEGPVVCARCGGLGFVIPTDVIDLEERRHA